MFSNIVMPILLSLALVILTWTLENVITKSDSFWPGWKVCLLSLAAAGATCASGIFAAKGLEILWLAWVCFVAMLALQANMIIWWSEEGNQWIEFLWFSVVTASVGMFSAVTGAWLADLVTGALLVSALRLVPLVLMEVSISYFLIDLLREKKHKTLATILTILTVVGAIFALAFGLDWQKKEAEAPASEPTKATEVATEAPAPKIKFWHDAVLTDDDKANDFDFGTDPVQEILLQKIRAGEVDDDTMKVIDEMTKEEIAKGNYELAELQEMEDFYELLDAVEVYKKLGAEKFFAIVTPEDVRADQFLRMKVDPTLTAGNAAWWDVSFHTRLLGDFMVNYEGQEEAWMRTINSAADTWIKDPELFQTAYENIVAHMEHADVLLYYSDKALTDQMYMDGFVVGMQPDVIVMKTSDHGGFFLVYKDIVKNTQEVTVMYRTVCGYQPTNCAEKLGVTPKVNPNTPAKPSSGGGRSSSSGGGKPSSSGGGAVITNPKDPTLGTPVGKNDVPGPGPNTNNGYGAEWSRVEEPTNSAHLNSYEEYVELIDETKEANEIAESHSKKGDDGHYAPTYTPPARQDATVHSNDDVGTGNGGIDVTTPVQNTHVKSNIGGSTTTADDPAGDHWGGPPD